jgi:hypothetical protein
MLENIYNHVLPGQIYLVQASNIFHEAQNFVIDGGSVSFHEGEVCD